MGQSDTVLNSRQIGDAPFPGIQGRRGSEIRLGEITSRLVQRLPDRRLEVRISKDNLLLRRTHPHPDQRHLRALIPGLIALDHELPLHLAEGGGLEAQCHPDAL